MTIEETILKAIDGGYKGDKAFLLGLPQYAQSQLWLDPAFWQALGKAMGWDGKASLGKEIIELDDGTFCR